MVSVFWCLMSSMVWMSGRFLVSGRKRNAKEAAIMKPPKIAGGSLKLAFPPKSTMKGAIVVPS